MVSGSKISPFQGYEVTVSILLFFSYLSIKIRFVVAKYCGCGHVIDYAVDSVENRFGSPPLLHHGHWPFSDFRRHYMKLLL